MVSPLLSQIKNQVNAGLKDQLLDGTLRRASAPTAVDVNGDATGITYTEFSMKGMVDTYSAFYRQQAGIPETDVKILILAGSLSVRPQKDDQVKFRSKWYQVRMVDTDPAEATWEIQAFEIPDPT